MAVATLRFYAQRVGSLYSQYQEHMNEGLALAREKLNSADF
jgi:hypothetical protein